MERSVCTSGIEKMRASSMTIAEPEASSFTAWPQPMPSMCPPMMYISFGYFVPTFMQITSWRSPGVVGSMLIARIAGSGCESESLFPPCSRMSLKMRLPPGPLPGVPRPLGDVIGATSASTAGAAPGLRRRRLVLIRDALDVLAAVLLELRLDPVDGVTIALRALPAVAELRQSFDSVLVSLEVEAIDEGLHGIVRRVRRGAAALCGGCVGGAHEQRESAGGGER